MHAIDLLKLLSKHPAHGPRVGFCDICWKKQNWVQIQDILDSSPVWLQQKDQKHDLFVTQISVLHAFIGQSVIIFLSRNKSHFWCWQRGKNNECQVVKKIQSRCAHLINFNKVQNTLCKSRYPIHLLHLSEKGIFRTNTFFRPLFASQHFLKSNVAQSEKRCKARSRLSVPQLTQIADPQVWEKQVTTVPAGNVKATTYSRLQCSRYCRTADVQERGKRWTKAVPAK